jgi:hypothetical protein
MPPPCSLLLTSGSLSSCSLIPGKRINMKKVIAYIASHFRKDKIWMRRSRPDKRRYQVGGWHLEFDLIGLLDPDLMILQAQAEERQPPPVTPYFHVGACPAL